VVAWILGAAVLLWVAGFDVIYACQDIDFDRKAGLHSIPARVGPGPALVIARLLHAGALAAMAAVGVRAALHPVYWVGWAIVAALLVWEHRLARADDLSSIGAAFFNMNAQISAVYFVTILSAVLIGSLT
jgi:4-hydroxybenzoate polyprenyltransferase